MDSVIVTGGSRGIGLAICSRLSAAGFNVIAVARSPSPELEKAIEETTRDGKGALRFEPFDLNDFDAMPEFARRMRKHCGSIYGLVNNAGLGTEGLLATMPNDKIEALLRLNVTAPILFTKYLVRGMMADGRGRIVNLSSIIASTGYNALSVYGASKAAMIGFTKSLSREVGRLGVTVNAIAPGFIDTEMTRGLDEVQRKRIADRSALRRLVEVEDVAAMVVHLMGDAGRNITGAVMTIDAGSTA